MNSQNKTPQNENIQEKEAAVNALKSSLAEADSKLIAMLQGNDPFGPAAQELRGHIEQIKQLLKKLDFIKEELHA
jgi:hypothetical protein